MRCRKLIVLLSLFFFLPAPGLAQHSQAAVTPLYEEQQSRLIAELETQLTDIYVFPDVAERMVTLINEKHASGAYRVFDRLDVFTAQLTRDLQSISHDKHLSVRVAAPLAVSASVDGSKEVEQAELRLKRARASNFGFRRLELLPGNIGYVDLRSFAPAEIGGPTAVAAMNFLAHSAAIIFDLRRNGGGEPSMIQLITSYLFEERMHLNSFMCDVPTALSSIGPRHRCKAPRWRIRRFIS